MIFAKLDAARRIAAIALRSAAMRGYIRLAHSGIRCHRSVRFGRGVRVRAFTGGTGAIGAGTMIHDFALLQVERGRLEIGKNCLIGRGSVIVCADAITIGDGTLMAEYVTIRDQDHQYHGDGRLDGNGMVSAPVIIGHDVWLAAKVTVTRGVEIAAHVVVGANSVVTARLANAAFMAERPHAFCAGREKQREHGMAARFVMAKRLAA